MMLIVSTIQFGLATGHVITLVVQLIRAYVGAADKRLSGKAVGY